MTAGYDILILAAGLGKRLRPLTLQIPKPLLPIYGTPLLERHLTLLRAPGPAQARTIAVNAHHLAAEIAAFLSARWPAADVALSRETEILGTAGAIARAGPHLKSDPFAVLNGDALFDPPFAEAIAYHTERRFLSTMVLTEGGVWPNVRVEEDRVVEIARGRTLERAFTFTGLQIMAHRVQSRLPGPVFSDIRDLHDELIREGRLGAFVWSPPVGHPEFLDIGSPRAYIEAHRRWKGRLAVAAGRACDGYGWVSERAEVADGAAISDSVILPGASIGKGAVVREAIVGGGVEVEGKVERQLITTFGTVDLGG